MLGYGSRCSHRGLSVGLLYVGFSFRWVTVGGVG